MMTTTAAKMAFRRKDLGWRGSGDAIVIVVVVCVALPLATFGCRKRGNLVSPFNNFPGKNNAPISFKLALPSFTTGLKR